MKLPSLALSFLVLTLNFSVPALAVTKKMIFGPSAPAAVIPEVAGKKSLDPQGPTRTSGGEYFQFAFVADASGKTVAAHSIQTIKLTAFSLSGQGQILVRYAFAKDPSGTQTDLQDLCTFKEGTSAKDHQGMVLLAANNSVEFTPPSPLLASSMGLVFESFGNSDATVMIETNFNDLALGDTLWTVQDRWIMKDLNSDSSAGSGADSSTKSPSESKTFCQAHPSDERCSAAYCSGKNASDDPICSSTGGVNSGQNQSYCDSHPSDSRCSAAYCIGAHMNEPVCQGR